MLRAIAFLLVTLLGWGAALVSGPVWGLVTYANVYFNGPNPKVNWWLTYLPDARWSLLASVVVAASMLFHRERLAPGRMRPVYLTLAFLIVTVLIDVTLAVDKASARALSYTLFTYVLVVFCLVKGLRGLQELRWFVLAVIALAAYLSLQAVFQSRVHARLENIGPPDALSSNEFGQLLAAVAPLSLPFILKGKIHERVVAVGGLVLCLNGFVLCNSRGALVALAAAGAYGVVMAGRRLRFLILIGCLAATAATYRLADQYFIQRISTLWQSEVDTEDALNTLSSGRLEIFRYGLLMARDHPFGAGPEGFRGLSHLYMPEEILTFREGAPFGVRAAHNSYLQVLVEQGVLGLIIFVWVALGAVWSLRRAVRAGPPAERDSGFLGLMLLGLEMSLVASLVGAIFGAQVYYEFLWWQFALATVGASIAWELRQQPVSASTLAAAHP